MDRKTLILKFGGSSVATMARIQAVAQRVAKISQQHRCVVVVSAMGDETDILLEQAACLQPHQYLREYDMLLATGEQKSMALMAMALRQQKVAARSLTGWQAKIQTTAQYSSARIIHIDTRVIEQCWQNNEVPVIAGFQGVCDQEITTLGRGGSDLTAVALAAALNADECQIFTDVTGVYSADPRLVPEALQHDEISYAAMLELASLGAQVLHARAVALACKMQVSLRVRSSFVEGAGTMVTHHIKKMPTISGIVYQTDQAVFSIKYQYDDVHYYRLLTLLNQHKAHMGTVHLSHATNNDASLSFALPRLTAENMQVALQQYLGADLIALESRLSQAQISVVGVGVASADQVLFQAHQWLAENHVRIQLATSSESRFSFYVDEAIAKKIVKSLHELFHLPGMADQCL